MADVAPPLDLLKLLNRDTLKALLNDKKTKRLALALAFGLCGLSYLKHKYAPDGKTVVSRPQRSSEGRNVSQKDIRKLLRIMIPSYKSREGVCLAILAALLLSRTIISGIVAEMIGSVIQSFISKDWKAGLTTVSRFLLLSFPASFINSGLKYYTTILSLQFRVRLSKYIHDLYLNDVIFYNITNLGSDKVVDVDQRITSDIQHFSFEASDLFSSTFKPILDIVLFTGLFARNVGWPGPALFYAYFLFTAIVKKSVMPSFGRLSARESELEGQYRSAHQRLITNSEEIAFYDGARRERVIVNGKLDEVRNHVKKVAWLRALVNVADQTLIKYWASMAGYLAMFLPVLFGFGQSKGRTSFQLARDYGANSRYLSNLADAVGQLVLLGNRLSSLKGYVGRLVTLLNRMESERQVTEFQIREIATQPIVASAAQSEMNLAFMKEWKLRKDEYDNKRSNILSRPEVLMGKVRVITGAAIKFEHVDIISPEGKLLVEDLNFDVTRGKNVMVTGPNGSGKSSLFRVIGDLWPPKAHGDNSLLVKPPKEQILFVPQKPYLVLGTLRDQVIYPHSREDMAKSGVTDQDLAKLLNLVDPENKILGTWKWDDVKDWFSLFSGGQKQRIAMARVFYHRPIFAILDECTSAVSDDVEDVIYNTCKDMGITLFTVSHRKTLRRHHDFELRFEGQNGLWRFKSIDSKKYVAGIVEKNAATESS